jgi:cell shape-determining protein MreD
MDNLSGSPFGLYLTSYFWLFIGVKGITKLLQVGKRVTIITVIVAAGVLAENLIFLGSFAIFSPEQQLADDAVKIVAGQILWALLTGSVFLIIFRNTHNWLDDGFRAFWARKSEN